MRSTPRLGILLGNLVTATAAGCGIDTGDLEAVPCAESGGVDHLTGLTPSDPVDYLALKTFDDFGAGGGAPHTIAQEVGEPCSGAPDRPTCEGILASMASDVGFALGECVDVCPRYYFVFTRGEDVGIVPTAEGARSFVLPVDSAADAVLLAELDGYSVVCGDATRGGVKEVDGGYEVVAQRLTSICEPIETTQYRLAVSSDGQVEELESEIISSESGCVGRRPAGLAPRAGRGRTAVGAYFASIAHLEAASVHAFSVLRRELAHHGAPARLVRAASRAAKDEVRHAFVVRRLAHRYGASAPRPVVAAAPPRSLEALAIENAVEGVVRETFGAAVGLWQARFAADPSVRRAMTTISADETRHATLSWAIDRWARSRLDAAARRRVSEAKAEALGALQVEALREVHPDVVRWAGVPDATSTAAMAARFAAGLRA